MLQVMDEHHVNRIRIADYLNDLDPEDFNMSLCNLCICGHINRYFLASYSSDWEHMSAAAAKWLGITEQEATKLFSPRDVVNHKGMNPDPRDAARVMRYLAATDTVDWEVGMRKSTDLIGTGGIGFDVLEETVVV